MTCWVGSSHSSHNSVKFVDLADCESEVKIRDRVITYFVGRFLSS